ncbi:LOW QUALITY PROTEIN: hypothetical protein NC651_029467 [Populus alba x Populus x berolinensis]|nr:LOW QUALITY PROTEIN: hypothetical protein NC651_029467 [Populus alba x Populus x berolinensis]
MPERDVVAWTTVISGYTHCNEYTQAWSVFVDMVKNGNDPPNAFTISSVSKGLDMYASCGVGMRDACVVFHDIKEKNVVSWTTLIAGYTHRGNGNRALQIFRKCYWCGCLSEANKYFNDMTEKDLITWNTLISRSNINMCECKQLCVVDSKFMEDFSQRGLDRNLELANALIDMYAKCEIFGSLGTSMMIGYGAHGLRLYEFVLMRWSSQASDLIEKAKWRRKLARMRKLMKRAGCRKVAGRSWIEVRKPALKVKLTNQAAETSTLAHEHPGSFQAI